MTTAALDNVRIVLVHTSHPGNIGAAARAMKNMGIRQLYLVAPKNYPAPDAMFRAASAMDVLDNAVVCETLDEALSGVQWVVGTSARERRIPWPIDDVRGCAATMQREIAADNTVAVLFGREDRGLTNDELQRCNQHLNIPTDASYSSLNLGMAVQVVSYELRMACLNADDQAQKPAVTADWDAPWVDAQDMERFYVHLEETLVALNFLKAEAPRQLMTRLRRLFNRQRMDSMELNILRGILTAAQKAVGRRTKAE